MIKKIKVIGKDNAVQFAARELAKYTDKITGKRPVVQKVMHYHSGSAEVWLGVHTDFEERAPLQARTDPGDDGFELPSFF